MQTNQWKAIVQRGIGALLLGFLGVSPAAANVVFSEDFETYAIGSNLIGQGGWVTSSEPGIGPVIRVGSGAFLPPMHVMNGQDATGAGAQGFAFHMIPALDPSRITTIAFDAFGPPGSHDWGVMLLTGPLAADSFIELFLDAIHGGWTVAGTVTPAFTAIGGGNQAVKMQIVVDGAANEIFARYDYGGGFNDTPHIAITDAQIAAINTVDLFVDYRGVLGGELDNLVVFDDITPPTPMPEPGTLVLLGFGLLGLAAAKWSFLARSRWELGC